MALQDTQTQVVSAEDVTAGFGQGGSSSPEVRIQTERQARILSADEVMRGSQPIGVAESAKRFVAFKNVPLVGQFVRGFQVHHMRKAAERVAAGTASEEDTNFVLDRLIQDMNDSYRGQTTGAEIFNTTAQSLSFAAEFAATGKLAQFAETYAVNLLGRALVPAEEAAVVASKLSPKLTEFLKKAVGAGARGAVRTGTLGLGMIQEDVESRLAPKMTLTTRDKNRLSLIIQRTSPSFLDFLKEIPKAAVRAGAEYTTEEMGGFLTRLTPGGKRLASMEARALGWLSAKTRTPVMVIAEKLAKQGQWHGLVGELLEEDANDFISWMIGDVASPLPSPHEFGVRVASFAIPGLSGVALGHAGAVADRMAGISEPLKPAPEPQQQGPRQPLQGPVAPLQGPVAPPIERTVTVPSTADEHEAVTGLLNANGTRGRMVLPETEEEKATERAGHALGRRVVFVEAEGGGPAGEVMGKTFGGTIALDVNAGNPMVNLLTHELLHSMGETDRKELIDELHRLFPSAFKQARGAVKASRKGLEDAGRTAPASEALLDEEAAALLAEDFAAAVRLLIDNPKALQAIRDRNHSLWERVRDLFVRLINKVTGSHLPLTVEKELDALRAGLEGESKSTQALDSQSLFAVAERIARKLRAAPVAEDVGKLADFDALDEAEVQALEEEASKAGEDEGKRTIALMKALEDAGYTHVRFSPFDDVHRVSDIANAARQEMAAKEAAARDKAQEERRRKSEERQDAAVKAAIEYAANINPKGQHEAIPGGTIIDLGEGGALVVSRRSDVIVLSEEEKMQFEEDTAGLPMVTLHAPVTLKKAKEDINRTLDLIDPGIRLKAAQRKAEERAVEKKEAARQKREVRKRAARNGELGFRAFVRASGGLRYDEQHAIYTTKEQGEAHALGPLMRREGKGGVPPDELLEAAIELQLLPPGSGFRELYDAIDSDLRQTNDPSLADMEDQARADQERIALEQQRLEEEKRELDGVREARDLIARAPNASDSEVLDVLWEFHQTQPKFGEEQTSTSSDLQQFSTPLPLAWFATWLARIQSTDRVYEPTAGNGALLMGANLGRVHANELDPVRADNLRELGASTVTERDATEEGIIEPKSVDVVITNPPFGRVADGLKSKVWSIEAPDGSTFKTKKVDHMVVFRSLEAMKDDGRAVLIIGGPHPKRMGSEEKRREHYRAGAMRNFMYQLYHNYRVVGHATIGGAAYDRQGAAWPVDVILIEGRGASDRQLPTVDLPTLYDGTAKEIYDALYEEMGMDTSGLRTGDRRGDAGGEEGPGSDLGGVSGRDSHSPGVDSAKDKERRGADKPGEGKDRDIAGADAPHNEPRGDAPGSSPGERGTSTSEQGGLPDASQSDGGSPGDESGGVERSGNKPPLSDEDLDALFDSALDEAEAKSKGNVPAPKEKPKGKPKSKGGGSPRGPRKPKLSTETPPDAPDWAKGLDDLFAVQRPEGFDEAKYEVARGLFKNAAEALGADAGDPAGIIDKIISYMRNVLKKDTDAIREVKVYVREFVKDVMAGRVVLGEETVKQPPEERVQVRDKSDPENQYQVSYEPVSDGVPADTESPAMLAAAMNKALEDLRDRVGPLSAFVADRLGYELDDVRGVRNDDGTITPGRFSGEQIDALALMLDNLDRKKGLVLGDQTGVGKGRAVAGSMRYARLSGLVPIFVTDNPGLFADIMRDLEDIGERGVRPFITNADIRGAKAILLPDGSLLEAPKPADLALGLKHMRETGTLPPGYTHLFTTYSQVDRTGGRPRDRWEPLRALVRNGAFLALDESHTAAGGQKEAPKYIDGERVPKRTDDFRELVDLADSVLYSSATWAKSKYAMGLYSKTDILDAVQGSLSEFRDVLENGGIALEQILSTMLAENGQFVRRERTYDGIHVAPVNVEIDADSLGSISDIAGEIGEIDRLMDHVRRVHAQRLEDPHGGLVRNDDGRVRTNSLSFASRMHNLLDQVLLTQKLDPGIDLVVDSMLKGQKPVIVVANTMERMFEDWMDVSEIAFGDEIEAPGFEQVFQSYINATLTYQVTYAGSNKRHTVRITKEELRSYGFDALADRYDALERAVRESKTISNMPLSPIDYIKQRVELKASAVLGRNVKVGEITGRGMQLKRTGIRRVQVLRRKPSASQRNREMSGFNSGEIDVLIGNESMSTGFSLHAWSRYKDQRPRHMILFQAHADVNRVMQIFGRINRMGQVVLPIYSLLRTNAPFERRIISLLLRKLGELHANTSADTGSLFSLDGVDYFNRYGDRVAKQVLMENPDLIPRLKISVDKNGVPQGSELARRVTTSSIMLPVEEAESLLSAIEASYRDYIETSEALGKNLVDAKLLELDAQTLQSDEIVPDQAGGNIFQRGTSIERMDVKRPTKPYTAAQMHEIAMRNGSTDPQAVTIESRDPVQEIMEGLVVDVKDALERARLDREALLEELDKAHAELIAAQGREDLDPGARNALINVAAKQIDSVASKIQGVDLLIPSLEANFTDIRTTLQRYRPGSIVAIRAGGSLMPIYGMVVGVKRLGRTKSPVAKSDFRLELLTTESKAKLALPLSKIAQAASEDQEPEFSLNTATGSELEEAVKDAIENGREIRHMITGNVVRAMSIGRRNGRATFFRDHRGEVRSGVLLDRGVSVDMAVNNQKVYIHRAEDIIRILTLLGGEEVMDNQGRAVSVIHSHGQWVFRAAANRSKVWRNSPKVRAVLGDFRRRRGDEFWYARTPSDEKALQVLRIYQSTLKAEFFIFGNMARLQPMLDGGEKGESSDRFSVFRKQETLYTLFTERGTLTESTWDRFLRVAVNYFRPFEKLRGELEKRGFNFSEDEDVVLGEELWSGRAQARMESFEKEERNELLQIMNDSGITLDEAHDFLYARHAVKRNEVIIERDKSRQGDSVRNRRVVKDGVGQEERPGSGMSRRDAERILADVAKDERREAFEGLGRRMDEINAETLRLRVAYGLLSEEEADEWRERFGEHYVPLMSDLDDEERSIIMGQGFSIRRRESYKARGRNDLAGNVLIFSMMARQAVILRGEKNMVGQRLWRFVSRHPDDTMWKEVTGHPRMKTGKDGVPRFVGIDLSEKEWERTVSVKVKGKEHWIMFEDPLFARAFKRMGSYPQSKTLRFMASLMRTLAALNTTFNAAFILSNFARDLEEATIHLSGERSSALAKRVFKDTVSSRPQRAIWHVVRGTEDEAPEVLKPWIEAYHKLKDAGGTVGWAHAHDFELEAKSVEQALREMDEKDSRSTYDAIVRRPSAFISDLNTSVENGVRLAAFVRVMEEGMDVERAASLAKNLTINFNRRGEAGPALNALWMFYNASVQGSARMLWSVANHKRTQKIVGGIVMQGILLDIVNRMMAGDDDNGVNYYDQIPDWIKSHNLILVIPGSGGRRIQIPSPYGYGAFDAMGKGVASMLPKWMGGAERSTGQVFKTTAIAFMDAFNPLGSESSLLQLASPTLLDPAVQIATNEKFYGAPIMPEQRGFGPDKPQSQLFFDSVNPTTRHFTTWLNRISGGDKWESGAIDVSPEIIEHVTEFVAGGAGKFMSRSFKLVSKAWNGEPIEANDVPITRRFYGGPWSGFTRTTFWEHVGEVEKARAHYRNLLKAGQLERARRSSDRDGPLIRLGPRMDAARKEVKALRDRIEVTSGETRDRLRRTLQRRMSIFNRQFQSIQ